MKSEMKYSEEQVNSLIQEALSLNAIHNIYNPVVSNGVLQYALCRPNMHWLKRKKDNALFECVASDDAVIVIKAEGTGKSEIIYAHDLEDYVIFIPRYATTGDQTVYMNDLPAIGSVYTHENGNVYRVYGYGNLNANTQNREKYPVNVHYVGTNGYTWDKDVENFNSKMTPGGVFEFNEGVQFEYMGITENGILTNGFLTKEIAALAAKEVSNG